ncbi:MAG: hypothetical protein MK116_10560 [Phycisphaerales bacterium]|nr:hypothetical protein [Phycisphaerales bacterium]
MLIPLSWAQADEGNAFRLVDGDRLPLQAPPYGFESWNGSLYGWDPCINAPRFGASSIALTRYMLDLDDSYTIGDRCDDDSDVLAYQLRLWQGGLLTLPGDQRNRRYHHPVLDDGQVPSLLLWQDVDGETPQTWLVNTMGSTHTLGSDYQVEPDATAACEQADTIGMATLNPGSGQALIRSGDTLVLFRNPTDAVTLSGFTRGHEFDCTGDFPCGWTISDIPRIGMVTTLKDGSTMAAFIVTMTQAKDKKSALYRVTVRPDGQQVTDLIAYEGQDVGPQFEQPTTVITDLGLTKMTPAPTQNDEDDSTYLRTIGVNSAGDIAFRCEFDNDSIAILLARRTNGALTAVVDTSQPFAGEWVCGVGCVQGPEPKDYPMLFPLLSNSGDVIFTGGLRHENPDDPGAILHDEFIGAFRRNVDGTYSETILVREYDRVDLSPCGQLFEDEQVMAIGSLSVGGFSPYLPLAVSEYGDVAVICRMQRLNGTVEHDRNDVLLIFNKYNEVVAWIREGDVHDDPTKLVANFRGPGGSYDAVELDIPANMSNFTCDGSWISVLQGHDSSFGQRCFLSAKATEDGDYVSEWRSPFGFARGSAGSDGRARAFGDYDYSSYDIPSRTFVLSAQVGIRNDSGSLALKCKSGVFALQLEPVCIADADRDGDVDVDDFSDLLVEYGDTGCDLTADFNHDGAVDIKDFSILLVHFGSECAP